MLILFVDRSAHGSYKTTGDIMSIKESESKKQTPTSNSGDQNRPERRKLQGGIAEGGRRKADRAVVAPINQSSRIWFGLSLVLTILIMIWTFSVPFRTEKPIFAWDKSDLPVRPVSITPEILHDPEHSMTDEEYRTYIWEIEDDLQAELKERNLIPDNLPDAKTATRIAEQKVSNLESELNVLVEMEKKLERGFDKKSLQYQAMESLRKQLEEADELLPAR